MRYIDNFFGILARLMQKIVLCVDDDNGRSIGNEIPLHRCERRRVVSICLGSIAHSLFPAALISGLCSLVSFLPRFEPMWCAVRHAKAR